VLLLLSVQLVVLLLSLSAQLQVLLHLLQPFAQLGYAAAVGAACMGAPSPQAPGGLRKE
jgi:hypothetical protein